MLTIRLTRVGKKNSPAYRVVVADKKRAVKRKFIEIIGNYNPILTPKTLVIDKERAIFWMSRGAQPSDTVRNLMCDLEILPKKEKANKVYGKKLSKKAIKEGGDKKVEAPIAEATDAEAETSESVEPEAPAAPTSEESESRPESVGKEIATEEPAAEVSESESPDKAIAEEAAEESPEPAEETSEKPAKE